jgi:hypothetical protein
MRWLLIILAAAGCLMSVLAIAHEAAVLDEHARSQQMAYGPELATTASLFSEDAVLREGGGAPRHAVEQIREWLRRRGSNPASVSLVNAGLLHASGTNVELAVEMRDPSGAP